jgi:hypothetical protein
MSVEVCESTVSLTDAGTLTELRVRTALRRQLLNATVAKTGIGTLDADGQHVWIARSALVQMGRQIGLDDAWENGVDDMVRYAATKGWVDDRGRVRAHVT